MIYPFNKWFVWKSDADNLTKQILALMNENADLKNSLNIAEPVSYGTITYSEDYNILRGLSPEVYLSDSFFNLTDMESAKVFTKETKVAYRAWTAQDHDCDNFSFALMGYWSEGLKSFATGIVWSDNHAFNIMIDKNKVIWIIEPQNNTYMTIDEAIAKSKGSLHYFPIRMVIL